MTQAVVKNINSVLVYKERIFIMLVVGIVISACAYGFLLQKAIVNVVEREKVSKEIKVVSASVIDLESKYLSIKNKINIELAHSKGFKDTEVTSFISKKALTAMVTSHEI